MADKQNTQNKIDELKVNPSVSAWEIEISSILHGERELALIDLGSADEYVRWLLNHSKDKVYSESLFRQALSNVVQGWHPKSYDISGYVTRMLDLIGAYSPPPGVIRVSDFLDRWPLLGVIDLEDCRYVRRKDLHSQALIVLGSYYSSPPQTVKREPGFRKYIRILREHLRNPRYSEYAAYAARRLLELESLLSTNKRVGSLIEESDEVLYQIVPLFMQPTRYLSADEELHQIYSHCLARGAESEMKFEKAVNSARGELERDEGRPVSIRIVTLHGDEISFQLSSEEQDKYFMLKMESNQEDIKEGEAVLRALEMAG